MLANLPKPIPLIIQQHAEESAHLRHVRSIQVSAPHVKLHHLRRLDDRLAAHLDGLAVAGEYGSTVCDSALESPGVGEVFAATVRAIEEKDKGRLDKLFALVTTVTEAQPGLISAFGWVSAPDLKGIATELLASMEPFRRQVGISACVMHRVDPGAILKQTLTHPEPQLRARSLIAAGELGRRDLLAACGNASQDGDETCRFWAAWSAVLLGNRDKALEALKIFVLLPNVYRQLALLVFKLLAPPQANELLKVLARDPANMRLLVQGAGIAGDPYYMPWLIKQMEDMKLARLAGESFSLITGLDLAYLDLERNAPEGVEFGPNDNPEDENVAMDEDDNLPWPDPAKIQAWWEDNKSHFKNDERYFMGAPVSREHCIQVLKEGYQRQRIAAAQYLCLLEPGAQLFPTSAPAWRQQRWLAKMN
ncbi:MAG TPA: TIGR02270 family protein [Nitrosospira sp.]|nr:TIGR02270 family protein [Nitrosospira sp.]